MTDETVIRGNATSEEEALSLIWTVAASIFPSEALENASLAEIVHDSLQHMRFVVAVEDALGVLLDDSAILDLQFEDEQRLAQDIVRLVAASRS